jgi:hypothetical protein
LGENCKTQPEHLPSKSKTKFKTQYSQKKFFSNGIKFQEHVFICWGHNSSGRAPAWQVVKPSIQTPVLKTKQNKNQSGLFLEIAPAHRMMCLSMVGGRSICWSHSKIRDRLGRLPGSILGPSLEFLGDLGEPLPVV